MPDGLDWYVWRVVRSPLCGGLHEVETHWSLDDLVQAHMTLDLEDELDAAANEAAEKQRR